MAVTFDAVGPSATGAFTTGAPPASPLTWAHTNGASADWLLTGVALDGSSANPTTAAHNPVTAMTYNSVSMGTNLQNFPTGGAGQTSGYVAVYGLQNPATGGADTASATFTNTGMDAIEGGSLSFITGGGSLGTAQTYGAQNLASVSITVVTTSSQSIVAVFMTNGSGGTSWTAGTSRIVGNTTGTGSGGAYFINAATIPGTGGNVTVSWTQTSDWYAAIAVEVLPPGTATGPSLGGRDMGQRPATVVTSAGWRSAQHSR